MVDQAVSVRAGAAIPRASGDVRLQGPRLARRFGLHAIAVVLGVVLMGGIALLEGHEHGGHEDTHASQAG